MAKDAQQAEQPKRRRRRASRTREQAEGVMRATDSAKDKAADTAQGARDAGESAAAVGDDATTQAASEIAHGAMEATRNVATTALGAAKDTLANGDRSDESLFRQVFSAAREAAGEVFEREARAAAQQAAEILTARGPEIAREQLAKHGGSNAAARAAVDYGRSKLEGAGGTKALAAAAVGAVKESAGGLQTRVTDALGSGDDDGDEGGVSRLPVEVALDIGAPREEVWDEWLQFENSPPSLHRIRWSDDGSLKVSARIWGSSKEEDAEIVEQVEQERLAWRVEGAVPYRGVVSLHALDENLTRLLVTLEFEPQSLLARLGIPGRVIQRGVEADVRRFKADLETRADDVEERQQLERGGDDSESMAAEPAEVDGEYVDELEDLDDDAADLDQEPQDAEVYEEDEGEDEQEPPEPVEQPKPRARTSSRRTSTPQSSRRSTSASKSGSGRSRSSSGSSSGRGSGSRSKASPAQKSGSRKASSASSTANKRSSGSRQRRSSNSG